MVRWLQTGPANSPLLSPSDAPSAFGCGKPDKGFARPIAPLLHVLRFLVMSTDGVWMQSLFELATARLHYTPYTLR